MTSTILFNESRSMKSQDQQHAEMMRRMDQLQSAIRQSKASVLLTFQARRDAAPGSGSGFMVWSIGFKVQGSGFRVYGLLFGDWS